MKYQTITHFDIYILKVLLTNTGTPEPVPEDVENKSSAIDPTGAVPLGMINLLLARLLCFALI